MRVRRALSPEAAARLCDLLRGMGENELKEAKALVEWERLRHRFWRTTRVDPVKGCWLWTGAISWTAGGYGAVRAGGKTRRATRVAWELVYSEAIPPGMFVLHRCDVPACVNPDHLFLGTPRDNSHDMIRKGRDRPLRGAKNGRAFLTAAQVIEIRERRAVGEKAEVLAAEYGVTSVTIYQIEKRQTWKSLP